MSLDCYSEGTRLPFLDFFFHISPIPDFTYRWYFTMFYVDRHRVLNTQSSSFRGLRSLRYLVLFQEVWICFTREYNFVLLMYTSTDCTEGTFGEGCSHKCSDNCNGQTCDTTTGHCLDGCTSGITGKFCDMRKLTMKGNMHMALYKKLYKS